MCTHARQTESTIAAAFHNGTLDRLEGQFIPCDYCCLWLSMPFVAIAYIIPFVGVIGIILALFNGSEQSQTYIRNFLNSDLPTQLVGLLLLGLALLVGIWPFLNYWPAFKLDLRGLRESWRERRTGEKRYGLLLAPDHFALRCFSPGYDGPFIIPRDRVCAFKVYSEYSSTSHQRHKYIVMTVREPDDRERHNRLPDNALDRETRKLHLTLTDWLAAEES